MPAPRSVRLPSGEEVPSLGQGTWYMGEDERKRRQEVEALRLGIDLGMTLIDTAEMYAEGGAERVVAEAIQGRRDKLFLVSKVYPHNASRRGAIAACERSLQRLGTDTIDLYLLHWRGSIPLAETLEAFASLQTSGKIRYWGVSNFDTADMNELFALPGGDEVTTNQVLYNLTRRGIEWDLLAMCQQRAVAIMAYSPVEQGRLARNRALQAISENIQMTPAQLALAWVLSKPGVIAIPKASTAAHVTENSEIWAIGLSAEVLAALDRAFPPPNRRRSLEML